MGKLFSAPKIPAAPPTPVMPTPPVPDDARLQEAKRRRTTQAAQRSGRASTILSETSDKLGG